MRLGVVSDTHGHLGSTAAAVRILEQQDVSAVLHCGDLGSPDIVSLFARWPAHFVFGNVDYDERELRDAIEMCGLTCHDRFGSLDLGGRKIAWLHSDDRDLFEQTIQSGQWDLVCYGHTHVPEYHQVGRTLVLNPGALYRANPRTIAIVDLDDLGVTHLQVVDSGSSVG
ncbi:MAG: YfcE family phosphodiesterase [Planctomycetes bacterium]|nr:YfcE family phosphodiesterase [Planctomycetota bacterium]